MVPSGTAAIGDRASSETLGVAVLIGMTVLVTAGVGLGVLSMSQEEQTQTAEIDFTFLGDTLVIIYQDETERVAGKLYIDGPAHNVSWAELDDRVGPEGTVGPQTEVRLSEDSAYGARPAEGDRFEVVYFTEEGDRVVLAVEEGSDEDGGEGTPIDPDDPPGPNDPDV